MAEQPVSLAFNLAPAEAPVQLALRVGGGGEEGGAAAERLQQAEVEVERLRQQLADLQVRAGGRLGGGVVEGS